MHKSLKEEDFKDFTNSTTNLESEKQVLMHSDLYIL